MRGLSDETWALVQGIFPPDLQTDAGDILVKDCGTNLPFCEAQDERGLERVRFAVLKLSGGNLEQLRSAVGHAQIDWRDVLVWAGFGNSLTAHKAWARDVL